MQSGKAWPRVVVLTTGGTTASRPDPSGGVVAAVSGDELLSAAPGIEEVADVGVEDLFRIGGYLMSPENMLALAAAGKTGEPLEDLLAPHLAT